MISYKEAIRLSIRGYRLWWKWYPEMLISSAFCAVVTALTPYAGIYLSALIINEIAGTRDTRILTRLILTALITSALLTMLSHGLSRWKNCQHKGIYYKRNKIYSEKLLSLDFRSIDDPHIHDLRSQIRQNEMWSGWGLTRLLSNYEKFIKAIMSIAGAVTLTITLFILRVPDNSGYLTVLNHPLFIVLIIIVMFTITFIAPMLSNKASTYMVKRATDARMGNRFFGFYGFMGYKQYRALDIRTYRQDILCKKNVIKTEVGFGPKSKIAEDARGPMGLLNALSAAVSQIFTGIVYIYVCLKAWGGAFGVGSVTQYISSITALSSGVSSLISIVGAMRNNSAFLRTTFEFIDIPNDMYQGSLTVEKRSDRKYEIEFKDVSFKYPLSDAYVLKNISIKFRVGERLAVVVQLCYILHNCIYVLKYKFLDMVLKTL